MSMRINIPRKREQELISFTKMGIDELNNLLSLVSKEGKEVFTIGSLRDIAKRAIGDNAGEIVSTLISLESLRRERETDVDKFVSNFTRSVEGLGWDEGQLELWNERSDILSSILKSPGINCVAKALDLGYDHDRIYYSGRVISDIRPIFNKDRTKISGGVTIHTLKIEYQENEEEKILSFVLDENDLKQLSGSLMQAVGKNEVMKEFTNKNCGIPVVNPSEDF